MAKRVKLGHAVLRAEVPALFARADVLVNNMRAGAPDKVVYEAARPACPCSRRTPCSTRSLPAELPLRRATTPARPRRPPRSLLGARGDRADARPDAPRARRRVALGRPLGGRGPGGGGT